MTMRTLILTLMSGTALVAACDRGPTDPLAAGNAIPALQSEHAGEAQAGLRVLSRNVFLGADLEPVVAAAATGDVTAISQATAVAWAAIQENDFPARARVIAREIAASGADVVGLQEVALFRTQFPGDGPPPGGQIATDVAYDYLEILMAELEARGARYSVAASGSSVDVELPAYDPTSPTFIRDIRYTDRDVVLVREDVEVVDSESGIYTYAVPVPGPLGISLPRGYNRVDLVHDGQAYHFANTHLETDETSVAIQTAQAQELVGMLQGVDVPTIVVGDLNGRPTVEDDGTVVYALLEGAGFHDAWLSHGTADNPDGYTCCFGKSLLGGEDDELFERIDYVFVRGAAGGSQPEVRDVFTVGDGARFGVVPDNRRISDHAGVFAALESPTDLMAE